MPIATSPIVPGVLTRDQLDWLNAYHRRVFEQLAPRLTDEERDYVLYPGKLTDADTFRMGNIGEIYPEDMEKLTAIIAGFLAAHKEEIA